MHPSRRVSESISFRSFDLTHGLPNSIFPLIVQLASEVVIRVRQRSKQAFAWLSTIQDILKSGSKIPLDDAKKILDEGDQLNLACQELKTLRGALCFGVFVTVFSLNVNGTNRFICFITYNI